MYIYYICIDPQQPMFRLILSLAAKAAAGLTKVFKTFNAKLLYDKQVIVLVSRGVILSIECGTYS